MCLERDRVAENEEGSKEKIMDHECLVDNEVVRREYGGLNTGDRHAFKVHNVTKFIGVNSENNMLREEDVRKEYAVEYVGIAEKNMVSMSLPRTRKILKVNEGQKQESEEMCKDIVDREVAKCGIDHVNSEQTSEDMC